MKKLFIGVAIVVGLFSAYMIYVSRDNIADVAVGIWFGVLVYHILNISVSDKFMRILKHLEMPYACLLILIGIAVLIFESVTFGNLTTAGISIYWGIEIIRNKRGATD